MISLCVCGHPLEEHKHLTINHICFVIGCECLGFIEKKEEPKITLNYISKQEYDATMNKEVIKQLLENPNIKWEHNPSSHELSLVPHHLEGNIWTGVDMGENLHGPDIHEVPPTRNDKPAIWDIVIEDMHKRDEFGREKHGGPLQPFNSRDALWDAYQEALDLVVYLRQAIYERDNPK